MGFYHCPELRAQSGETVGPQTTPRKAAQNSAQQDHPHQAGQHATSPNPVRFFAKFESRQPLKIIRRDRLAFVNTGREEFRHAPSQLIHLLTEGAVPPVASAGQIG